jgi:hypothetical protein
MRLLKNRPNEALPVFVKTNTEPKVWITLLLYRRKFAQPGHPDSKK